LIKLLLPLLASSGCCVSSVQLGLRHYVALVEFN
jgi:hypothetical protein